MIGRALFHDEDDARTVASRLAVDGFEAQVVRARFAGEDDDEDQPWSVLTDAPAPMVELLAEAHEGWMDYDDPEAPTTGTQLPAEPLPLPSEPVRVKRPPSD